MIKELITMDMPIESVYHDYKLVADSIVDDKSYQEADVGILLSNLYDVVKALEKQIPEVPCYSGDGYYKGKIVIDTWECPCCGKQYEVDYDDYQYCPKCGQHIDHSTLTEYD